MKNGIEKAEKLIAHIAARIEAGGLTYAEAVILDELLAVMVKVRSGAARVAEDRETGRGNTPELPPGGFEP